MARFQSIEDIKRHHENKNEVIFLFRKKLHGLMRE